jgi:hypothetical protein
VEAKYKFTKTKIYLYSVQVIFIVCVCVHVIKHKANTFSHIRLDFTIAFLTDYLQPPKYNLS